MREIRIGEQVVRVRATPLALLFYRQEFKRDLTGDLLKMVQGMVGLQALMSGSQQIDLEKLDLGGIDSVVILQIIWAMAKADAFGSGSFPAFFEWVASYESLNVFDPDLLAAVMEEAGNGFFRSRTGAKPPLR